LHIDEKGMMTMKAFEAVLIMYSPPFDMLIRVGENILHRALYEILIKNCAIKK
jgi:hypothetical protein